MTNETRLINADVWKLELLLMHGTNEKTAWLIDRINHAPTIDAIPVVWIKEWVEEIKDHPAYTEEEKTLCIEEFEDMLGAWAERKEE